MLTISGSMLLLLLLLPLPLWRVLGLARKLAAEHK
jgi:hypothetical protein